MSRIPCAIQAIYLNIAVCTCHRFPGGSVVKNPPATQEAQVQSLGQEELLKGMATRSSILAWEIPLREGPGGLQSWGYKKVGYDLATKQEHMSILNSQSFPPLPGNIGMVAYPFFRDLPKPGMETGSPILQTDTLPGELPI